MNDDFYDHQKKDEYENSHSARLDYFAQRFGLDKIQGKRILDIGCGLGFLFERIPTHNEKVGVDFTNHKTSGFTMHGGVNLDTPFADKIDGTFDIITCLETLEHLQNPYNCLLEVKKLVKPDGIILISVPTVRVLHNTIYPGLLYPVSNFITFLEQLAFKIELHEVHNKNFSQEVFQLKNLDWHGSKMLFHKQESKFRGVPPHVAVNL